MDKLKSCPFCGGLAYICGEEITDYCKGTWAPASRKEYWVQTHCWPSCLLGNISSRAFGIIGGIRFTSEEAAIKAWNKRVET